jgi:hypothetical protein
VVEQILTARSMQMSKKNLLNENTVRRFMTLAGNNKYTSNFINETWSQNAAGLEEGLYEDDLEEGGMGMYEDDLEEGGMGMYEDDLEEGHGMFEDEMEEDLYEQDMIPRTQLAWDLIFMQMTCLIL